MLKQIQEELTLTNTTLIAVSKTKPLEKIKQMYDRGQKIFGENKVQELVEKQSILPKDIKWHQIGHLQTNKVKYIAPFVSLIHAVDSFKLLKEINRQGSKNKRVIDCLLQFHIASESSKFGLDLSEAIEILQDDQFAKMKNIRLVGVMGMATLTEDKEQIRSEFKQLKTISKKLKKDFFTEESSFKELSMGMSGDYQIAVEEGSTMVRIGSLLFGRR